MTQYDVERRRNMLLDVGRALEEIPAEAIEENVARSIRTASVYRTQAKSLKSEVDAGNYNESDQVQFEICEFSDGYVAQRWMTVGASCVWWESLEKLKEVHVYAHPDYGTRIVWDDGTVEEL